MTAKRTAGLGLDAVVSAGFWGIVFLALPPRQTPAAGRSWLRLIVVAVVLLAGAARRAAAEDDAWSVSPCDCARQPVCWGLAMKAYAQRIAHSKAEVDGSLPLSRPEGALYHPVTWSATAEGETVVAELRRCRPGLFDELAAVVVAGKKG